MGWDRPRIDEATLKRYLLCELSETEQTQLEDRLFSEESEFEQLKVAEDELIDAYVLKELSSQDRDRFEQYFLTSPRRQERVNLASSLLVHASSLARNPREPGMSWHETVGHFVRMWWSVPQLAVLSTCLAIGIGLVSAFLAGNIVRNQIARSQTLREQQLQREVETRDNQLKQAAEQLRREQSLRAEAQQQLSRANSVSHNGTVPQSTPALLSFVLTPGSVRGTGESKRLVIPANSSSIRLQLDVSTELTASRYRIVIRNGTGGEVWSRNVVNLGSTNPRMLAITVPSDVLQAGDYTLELLSAPSDGPFVTIEDYVFRVIRPGERGNRN